MEPNGHRHPPDPRNRLMRNISQRLNGHSGSVRRQRTWGVLHVRNLPARLTQERRVLAQSALAPTEEG